MTLIEGASERPSALVTRWSAGVPAWRAELNAILALAYRDLTKFLRDPARLISTMIFPFAFIGILGGSFQASFGRDSSFDFMAFVFTGVLAQTLFQSSAMGIVSLIADRENDFSQEMFVAPISRYSIVLGKIAGETLVALAQGLGVIVFGLVVGAGLGWQKMLMLLPVAVATCFVGGAFGVLVLANIGSQRAANQVFPFIMLPQLFTAGVFNPIDHLPPLLSFLSHISPMRYAVDLTRGVFYQGHSDYASAVAYSPAVNAGIMAGIFLACLVAGTWLFVRQERNR
jgi:ABC-2 type transport system permease protein